MKNIRIENQKNWQNDIKRTLISKIEAKNPEDLLKVVTDTSFIEAYNKVNNWDKDIEVMHNQDSKELTNDTINLEVKEVFFHE